MNSPHKDQSLQAGTVGPGNLTGSVSTSGPAARDAGMALAARHRERRIRLQSLRFLEATLVNPDYLATTDAVADGGGAYPDGGRWRGSIPQRLAKAGLIAQTGQFIPSRRPSRHCGRVAEWRAVNLDAIRQRCCELRRWLAEHPEPVAPVGETLFDHLAESEVANG